MAEVQVLMAVYNGSAFLREQIDSIINQSYTNWELLVSDDGSEDTSLELIHEYCDRDPRIHLCLEGKRYGSAKAHFMALTRIANAPYIMYADQDDVWDEDKIELTLNALKQQGKDEQKLPLLACTDLRVVDVNLKPIHPSMLKYSNMDASTLDFGYFLASCIATGCTIAINQPLLKLLQKECEIDSIIMHDWWASLVASAFGKVIYLNRQTISYRQHHNNSVGADQFSALSSLRKIKDRSTVAESAVRQTHELIDVYGNKMPEKKRQQAEAILAITQKGIISRIILLTKAKVWRRGLLRNAATLLSFLLIKRETSTSYARR